MRLSLVPVAMATLGLVSGALSADILHSPHNFLIGQADPGEVCKLCHGRPRELSERARLTGFKTDPDSGPAFAAYAAARLPAGANVVAANVSVVCQSCHDGVTGDRNRAGRMGNVAGHYQELSCGHPISVGFRSYAAAFGQSMMVLASAPLYRGKVECVSCHDVHQATRTPYLLRGQDGITALCLDCHPR